jgi:5-methylcytosine-specific restriction endonuclease McrA
VFIFTTQRGHKSSSKFGRTRAGNLKGNKLIKAVCQNCGTTFFAPWDRLDHTGFIHSFQSRSGVVIKDYAFCCYDCEKAFVERLEKQHPEIKGEWTPADEEQVKKFPEYYKERTCALCGSKKKLKLSHIIPRFVVKWLKDTSASGFLRTGDPGDRIQDAFKINLLCEDCEGLFSVWENYFAEHLFYLFQEGSTELLYDGRLIRFVVSIAWRLLRVHLYELIDDATGKGYAEAALEVWKDYLLGVRGDPGPYENHIFFLDRLDTLSVGLPEKFLWYTLRSIDSAIIVSADTQIFTFAKLLGVLLVSSINPPQFKGWKVTKIEEKGKIELPQEITHTDILQFLVDRSGVITHISLSETEQNKIAATMRKRREKILGSRTLQTLLAEGKRRRNKLIGKINPAVKQLVEIIDCAQTEGGTPEDTQALVGFGLHLIADALIDLPNDKADQLMRDMRDIILMSKSTYSEASGMSDLGNIVVILHVLPKSTKEQQVKKIEESFVQIEKNNLFSKAEEILVLAWNPCDEKPSFELSYEIR